MNQTQQAIQALEAYQKWRLDDTGEVPTVSNRERNDAMWYARTNVTVDGFASFHDYLRGFTADHADPKEITAIIDLVIEKLKKL